MTYPIDYITHTYVDGSPYHDYVHIMTPEDKEMISGLGFDEQTKEFVLRKLIPNNMIHDHRWTPGVEINTPISELDNILIDTLGFALPEATQYVKEKLTAFNKIMVILIDPDILYEIPRAQLHGHLSTHIHPPLWNEDGTVRRACRSITVIIPISTPYDNDEDFAEFSSEPIEYEKLNFESFSNIQLRAERQRSLALVEPTYKLAFPKEGKYLIFDFNSTAIPHRAVSNSKNKYVCLVVEY